jgi:hypothetical protein
VFSSFFLRKLCFGERHLGAVDSGERSSHLLFDSKGAGSSVLYIKSMVQVCTSDKDFGLIITDQFMTKHGMLGHELKGGYNVQGMSRNAFQKCFHLCCAHC